MAESHRYELHPVNLPRRPWLRLRHHWPFEAPQFYVRDRAVDRPVALCFTWTEAVRVRDGLENQHRLSGLLAVDIQEETGG